MIIIIFKEGKLLFRVLKMGGVVEPLAYSTAQGRGLPSRFFSKKAFSENKVTFFIFSRFSIFPQAAKSESNKDLRGTANSKIPPNRASGAHFACNS